MLTHDDRTALMHALQSGAASCASGVKATSVVAFAASQMLLLLKLLLSVPARKHTLLAVVAGKVHARHDR